MSDDNKRYTSDAVLASGSRGFARLWFWLSFVDLFRQLQQSTSQQCCGCSALSVPISHLSLRWHWHCTHKELVHCADHFWLNYVNITDTVHGENCQCRSEADFIFHASFQKWQTLPVLSQFQLQAFFFPVQCPRPATPPIKPVKRVNDMTIHRRFGCMFQNAI